MIISNLSSYAIICKPALPSNAYRDKYTVGFFGKIIHISDLKIEQYGIDMIIKNDINHLYTPEIIITDIINNYNFKNLYNNDEIPDNSIFNYPNKELIQVVSKDVGIDLFNYLQKNNINYINCLHSFTNVLEGIAFFNKLNIIHRDIKPTNITYDESLNKCFLIDFGLTNNKNDIFKTIYDNLVSIDNIYYYFPIEIYLYKYIDQYINKYKNNSYQYNRNKDEIKCTLTKIKLIYLNKINKFFTNINDKLNIDLTDKLETEIDKYIDDFIYNDINVDIYTIIDKLDVYGVSIVFIDIAYYLGLSNYNIGQNILNFIILNNILDFNYETRINSKYIPTLYKGFLKEITK